MSRRLAAGLLQTLLARSVRTGLGSTGSLKAAHGLLLALSRLQQLPGASYGASSLRQGHCRGYSEELHTGLLTNLAEGEYHKLADHTLEGLQERIEAYVEDLDIEGDVEYSQGVMTIRLGSHGTYVINKQTPNRQIWMSSPVSGPVRYDYIGGQWVYHRDGHSLLGRLKEELHKLTGAELQLQSDN